MPIQSKFDALALFFSGEGSIPILLALFVAVIALVWFCSWFLVRRFKARFGRHAYLIGAIPAVIVVALVTIEALRETPSMGPPKILPASKLAGMVQGLPEYARFGFAGVAYFQGNLYASSNLGLIEIQDGRPTRLYQFQSQDTDVSGPWLDRVDNTLWATDNAVNGLLRFDGSKWTRLPMPKPIQGYYSRGDVLEGVQIVSNEHGFWMTSAGTAWKWDSSNERWLQIGGYPPAYKSGTANNVIGVLPIGQTPLVIVRHEELSFLVHPDEDFASDEVVLARNQPDQSIPREAKRFLADTWAVDREAGYICTTEHQLIRVTMEHVTDLNAPGPCETLATGDDMALLASIQGKGVYRYSNGSWIPMADSPYPSGAGEYWTHLSSASGQMALVIAGKPVIDHEHSEGTNMKFVRNAPTKLWVFEHGRFNAVNF